jgi:hypothetical protein
MIAPDPSRGCTGSKRKLRMRDHALRIEEFDAAQAVALGAGAHRVVEGKEPRLELGERVAALRARKARREEMLLAGLRFDRDGPLRPRAAARSSNDSARRCFTSARTLRRSMTASIGVLDVALQPRRRVRSCTLPSIPHARESLRAQLVEQLGLLAAARGDDRGEHHQAVSSGSRST